MAPADIATGPAVAAPIAATAPVRAPRAVGTAVPLPPLSPIAPKKPRRGKIGAVRPPTGSTQSSATDIYAPVGSAALIVEAEWAKTAAAVAGNEPAGRQVRHRSADSAGAAAWSPRSPSRSSSRW